MSTKRKARQESATVKVSDLMTSQFQHSLSILMSSDELSAQTSYEALQVFEAVIKHQKHFEEVRMKILSKYCEREHGGELMMNASKNEYVVRDRPAFDKEYAELMNVKADIPKISLGSITSAKISPVNLKPLLGVIVSP